MTYHHLHLKVDVNWQLVFNCAVMDMRKAAEEIIFTVGVMVNDVPMKSSRTDRFR